MGPNAAEIAEKIKKLNASHTVEAAAERTATGKLSAEEPVTSRILRRAAEEPTTIVESAAVTTAKPVPEIR